MRPGGPKFHPWPYPNRISAWMEPQLTKLFQTLEADQKSLALPSVLPLPRGEIDLGDVIPGSDA